MSLRPGRPTPVVWQWSAALQRSLMAAVTFAVAAVVLHRPTLALFAVPFAAHALRGWWRRASLDGAHWQLNRTATVLTEGQASLVTAEVDRDQTVTTVAWTPRDLLHLAPGYGVSTAARPQLRLEPKRWGRHEVGPGVVAAQDLGGAWRASERIDPFDLRVRPSTSVMVGGSGVRTPLGINGVHLSQVRGEGTEIAEVRQYRPGDRMRRINWHVSSRSEELFVVDAHTERETDVLIVLDTARPALELTEDPTSSLDLTVRATLAIARHYLDFGDRVGVHDLGHRVGRLPLRSGAHQLTLLNEVLSRTDRSETKPAGPLRPTRTPRPGTLVFVCTPLLEDAVLTEIGRLRNAGAEVVVIDTLPPEVGRTRQAGQKSEHGRLLADAWVIRRLQRANVLDQLRDHGVPVTDWTGPASLAAVLLAMEQARHAPRLRR